MPVSSAIRSIFRLTSQPVVSENTAMVDVNDGRHFSNPFSDWSQSSAQPFELDSKWKDAVTARLNPLIEELYYQSAQLPSSDISMYTGLAGIGYFFHRLSVTDNTLFDTEKRQRAAENAQKIASRCLRHLDINRLCKNVSVFTSSVGALCLTVLSYRSDIAPSGATAASPSVEECLKQVLRAHEFAVAASSDMPNEALYGRTGYLNALVMLHSAGISVPNDIISSVVNAILSSGVRKAKQYQADGQYRALMRRTEHRDLPMPPLMFDWHDKAYLGGAHGFAGILLTLLKIHRLFPNVIQPDALEQLIIPTVHWISQLQLPSGNWPSSLGDSVARDILVHWCHGATGLIPLMIEAYKISHDESYMKRALKAGDAIWKRGLLHKGCGLCHGSAGSGYALLDLYRGTGNTVHLYRAAKFAEWCMDYGKNRTRVADRPFSLFEGLAGTLYFLVDILNPMDARFPLLSGS